MTGNNKCGGARAWDDIYMLRPTKCRMKIMSNENNVELASILHIPGD